jgi:hypothetical protein
MRYLVLFFILLINGGSSAQVVPIHSPKINYFICINFLLLVARGLYKTMRAGMKPKNIIRNENT